MRTNPIIYAIPVFILTIVLEAWLTRRRNAGIYDLPDAVTSLQHGVLSQVANAFTKLATVGIYVAVYDQYRATTWPTSSALAWVAALILYDFFYYWYHRLSHEVALLWAAHVAHHSSEYYNLSTALRQSSTAAALGWMFYLPMAVAGVQPAMFVVVAIINLLYQYWPHTQLVGKLGWVDRVLVTPSNHRVHHGQNDYCLDVNYGGILIVWDRLFGTFSEERDDEEVCFGVRKPLVSFNPLWGNLYYYADLWQQARATRGWRDKLHVWLGPPGGWRATDAPHFDPSGFRRYDEHTPGPLRWYGALQHGLITLMLMHFLAVETRLTIVQAATYGFVMACGIVSVGALFEQRHWGKWLEQARVLALGGAFAAIPAWFGSDTPIWLRAAVAFFALCCVAWLSRQNVAPQTRLAPAP